MNAEKLLKLNPLSWEEMLNHRHEQVYLVSPNLPNTGSWAVLEDVYPGGDDTFCRATDAAGTAVQIYKSDVDAGQQLVYGHVVGVIVEARQTIEQWEEEAGAAE